ncbi:MAG: thioredoxin family protein [Clostridia bacterium]|nr:thioredoxin family protein [Clostridia bacterium]
MALFNADITKQLTEIFQGLKNPVKIVLFTDENNCESCNDTTEFMKEIEAMSDKIGFTGFDLKKDAEEASKYGIDKAPAIRLLDENEKDYGVTFYGIPAGHEINSFIAGLMELSGAGEVLPEAMKNDLAKVDKKVNIKVFVTLSCPHCSGAVSKAHKLAYENPNVEAEMIECGTFPELADKYNVSGVPKIVFNDTEELIGNQPFDQFLSAVLKAK